MLKKIVIGIASVGAMTLAASALADAAPYTNPNPVKNSGFYIAGQTGYGWIGEKINKVEGVTTHKGGITGRVAVGYHLNQYFGLESGLSYLPSYGVKATTTVDGKKVTNKANVNGLALDLMAMGTLPINDSFFAFGGAGAAVVHNYLSGSTKSGSKSVTVIGDDGRYFIRPKLTAGVGYKITRGLAATVQYDYIFKITNKNGTNPPSYNAVTAGIMYSF